MRKFFSTFWHVIKTKHTYRFGESEIGLRPLISDRRLSAGMFVIEQEWPLQYVIHM